MAQNNLVVVGIDVAKDKVDVCIRPLSQRRTFPNSSAGRRGLIAWLGRYKAGIEVRIVATSSFAHSLACGGENAVPA